MASVPNTVLTAQQYLDLERSAKARSEFYNGQMVAMSGASRKHNLIAMNIGAEMHSQFKGRACEVFMSDMRVRIKSTNSYVYPDVVAACDNSDFEDNHVDTLLNPQIVFEVLSPSTEAHDRGMKFDQYKQLLSLQQYVLVSQDRMLVEGYVRQSDGAWLHRDYRRGEDILEVPSVDVRLILSDIYQRVTFDDNPNLNLVKEAREPYPVPNLGD